MPWDGFHDLAADLDYPMLIVTAAADGERAGCLVGFAAQCSIDPLRAGRVLERRDMGDHVGFILGPIEGEAPPWSGQLGFRAVMDIEPGHDP